MKWPQPQITSVVVDGLRTIQHTHTHTHTLSNIYYNTKDSLLLFAFSLTFPIKIPPPTILNLVTHKARRDGVV